MSCRGHWSLENRRGGWSRSVACLTMGAVLIFSVGGRCQADDTPDAAAVQKSRSKAIDYLRTTQAEDGSWTTNKMTGITGLVVIAALRNGVVADDPMIAKAMSFLSKSIQKDGGVYAPKANLSNYETCIAIVAFREANKDGKYDKVIENAAKFVRNEQFDENKGLKPSDTNYGGAGYGGPKSRPDLSNTQFLIEALRASGAKPDDPALKKALVFVSRCQNLESQANTTEFSAKVGDGGFYYTPSAGGGSPAGKEPDGGLRSYGTMTYAGLKSMIHCDLKADDPRVKAAIGWIRKHYTVTQNPGIDKKGLFYYRQTFAKALEALGQDVIEDESGKKHDWRQDLVNQLIAEQKENGSWVNSDRQWMETNPQLATAFSLIALSYSDPPAKKEAAKP